MEISLKFWRFLAANPSWALGGQSSTHRACNRIQTLFWKSTILDRFVSSRWWLSEQTQNQIGSDFFTSIQVSTKPQVGEIIFYENSNISDCSWHLVRRSQGYGFSYYEDNLRGTLEEGEFGFENDFTVRFDNLDYDQVGNLWFLL